MFLLIGDMEYSVVCIPFDESVYIGVCILVGERVHIKVCKFMVENVYKRAFLLIGEMGYTFR